MTNGAFNTAKGYQDTKLAISAVTVDKKYTCYMNVNNVIYTAEVNVDVIG